MAETSTVDTTITYTVYIEESNNEANTSNNTDLFTISYKEDIQNKILVSYIKLTSACIPTDILKNDATHILVNTDMDLDAKEWFKIADQQYTLKDNQVLKLRKNPSIQKSSQDQQNTSTDTSSSAGISTGVIMNWALTPVEDQVPQINWRQDINSDDKPLSKLASYQMNDNNLGSNGFSGCSLKPGSAKAYMEKNYEEMKAGKIGSSCLPDEKSIANQVEDNFLQQMIAYKYQSDLERISKQYNVDIVLIAAIITVESGGYPEAGSGYAEGLMQLNPEYHAYRNTGNCEADAKSNMEEAIPYFVNTVPSETGVTNLCMNCMAYNRGAAVMDELGKTVTNNNSSNSSGSSTIVKPKITDSSTWCDLFEYFEQVPSETKTYFPKIVYAYHILLQHINKFTVVDNPNGMCFPIENALFNKTYYYKNFGIQNQTSGVTFVSEAIVLKVPRGTEVMAADYCYVSQGNNSTYGKHIIIKCTSQGYEGYTVTYCNLDEYIEYSRTNDSETCSKGSVIATTGVSKDGVESLSIIVKDANNKAIDPTGTLWWPILAGAYSEDASKSLKEFVN